MSGRGRSGRGRGYGRGRGRGRFHRKKSFKRQQFNFKELKFAPHLQGKAQSATYASVKEAVIQQIQKTYKGGIDVSKCLKDMQKIDLDALEPTRQVSNKTNEAEKFRTTRI